MKKGHDVLVVDDDRDLRAALVMMLEAEGHTVVEAEHGRDALDRMASVTPHLIILDLTMPVMDGRAFLRHKAKSAHAHIPVVIFSSSPTDDLEALPNVVSVVHKLSGIEALLAAIQHAASKLAAALDPGRPAQAESAAFAKLQKQLLGLGILDPIVEATCSSCARQVPLLKDSKPGLCLACLARARGFEIG